MAHKGGFPLEERLMAAGMNGAAFAMAYFRFPTVETADSHASALCMASQTMVAVKYIYCTNCTRKIKRKNQREAQLVALLPAVYAAWRSVRPDEPHLGRLGDRKVVQQREAPDLSYRTCYGYDG